MHKHIRSELKSGAETSVASDDANIGAATDDRDDLWDIASVCEFFGGMAASTLYRGIATGRYPKPIKTGPHMNRWLRSECLAARADMIAARAIPRVAKVSA